MLGDVRRRSTTRGEELGEAAVHVAPSGGVRPRLDHRRDDRHRFVVARDEHTDAGELGPQVRHVLGLHADECREQLVVGTGAEGQRDERLTRFG